MNRDARSMTEVLQWRERKYRLALARLSLAVEKRKNAVSALDELDTMVLQHLMSTRSNSFAGGAATAGDLVNMQQHVANLHAKRQQIAQLRQDADQALQAATAEQRTAALDWQRTDRKAGHVKSLTRREHLLRSNMLEEEGTG